MTQSRLELRSWPVVVVAYVLAPLIALAAWYLVLATADALRGNLLPLRATTVWLTLLTIGGVGCLVVELVVITPLLLTFRWHRWGWLNGWSGAGIGFLIGFVPQFMFGAMSPSTNPQQIPGSISLCARDHCTTTITTPATGGATWEVNGNWTLAGWAHVVGDAASMGSIGLVTAIAFRVIAIRSAR